MWSVELKTRTGEVSTHLGDGPNRIHAEVHPTATLDASQGPIAIGHGTKVCENAVIRGPVIIGEGCIIGTNTVIRGATFIGDKVLIGNGAEVKNAIIEDEASLGPYSYVADSIIREAVFLGALVRTSNYRLDDRNIEVMNALGERVDSGTMKLGACIGKRAKLGVGCIVFPGRTIAADSQFGPGINITKNLPTARYSLRQELSTSNL
ncbi:acetyltransferase [Lysobacter pythonis]|uniref:Acetyltransferase n=1 Tax=Solilutibacter pythonis TaxID=2483112 RepID=A0A3M2HJ11_9GAMM|nr:acetyltransferase [Lysobacter pythonis]RMH88375.1 acetyltransferase [Lysobacter pythonis]